MGQLNTCPMVREQLFDVTDQMLAEHHYVVGRADGECAEIENLVVQRAQGKAVLLDVRPAGLEPLDVRGFESDYLLLEP